MLIQRYKVEVKDEPQYANETFEQRKARLMSGKQGITITYALQSLILTRRNSNYYPGRSPSLSS